MKTFKEFQELGAKRADAKKTLILRAEVDGEIYETEHDATTGLIFACTASKDNLVKGTIGNGSVVANLLIGQLLGLPADLRRAVMLTVVENEITGGRR